MTDATEGTTHSQFRLLAQRRFLPFYVTQFLGAFNDNVFKNALIIMIAFQAIDDSSVNPDILTNLSAGLFILPFFLFSATAGLLIEKHEKSLAMRRIKLMEVVIMLVAAWGFVSGHLYLLIFLLFMMGVQSTLFGPAKYSYIPQHIAAGELLGANGLVQTGTFVAILIGTMCGGILVSLEDGRIWVALAVVIIAAGGYLSSLSIPHTPSANPDLEVRYRPFGDLKRNVRLLRDQGVTFMAVLGISWFWFLGASYLVQLPSYTKTALGANEQVVTLLLTLFTLGVGTGSLLCNRLLKGSISLKLLPIGVLGLTLPGIDLYLSTADIVSGAELIGLAAFLQAGNYRVIVDVLLIGIAGGLYIVPLFSYVQSRVDGSLLSRVIAGNNIFNALYMVLSAVMAMLLLGNGVSIAELFLLVSLLNLVHGAIIIVLLRRG